MRLPLMRRCPGFAAKQGISAARACFSLGGFPGLVVWVQLLLSCLYAADSAPAGRIVLVPIDDRPAVAQFAQMIGAIADYEVVLPPYELLGRFTKPGDPKLISNWLRGLDYSRVDAVILSVDMLAYGGLIASRSARITLSQARQNLDFLSWFKKAYPKIPLYAFSVLMRVAPTADATSRSWHDDLARWSELQDRVARTGDAKLQAELQQLDRKLPPEVIKDYLSARQRDLVVTLQAMELYRHQQIDRLILLQDDARVYGLHRRDQQILLQKRQEWHLEDRLPLYNGADEGSLTLVSQAILERHQRNLKVFPVFSSARSRQVIAPYEDHPLEYTVDSQIRASGAVPATSESEADYKLYVNAPQTGEGELKAFLDAMIKDLKKGRAVVLADVLFPPPHASGADERIIRRLEKEKLLDRFAGYAAWNTAGNTLGTAIPQGNLRLLAIKDYASDSARSRRSYIAHQGFLLHRFAGDYLYHDIVRPQINQKLRQEGLSSWELSEEIFQRVNGETAAKLKPLILDLFHHHFRGKDYGSWRIVGLENLEVSLPWARTFEVAIRYRLVVGERAGD